MDEYTFCRPKDVPSFIPLTILKVSSLETNTGMFQVKISDTWKALLEDVIWYNVVIINMINSLLPFVKWIQLDQHCHIVFKFKSPEEETMWLLTK